MISQTDWSGWHHRLHQRLLRHPKLLPQGSNLLLAISGGQDSMALLGLLHDLRRLHGWTLQLWHGNHGWHGDSAEVADALAQWCNQNKLSLKVSHAAAKDVRTEAMARDWRYQTLLTLALQLNCDVVTAHTATDRAETVLLNLARGCDLQGLSSLSAERTLSKNLPQGPKLKRPLLHLRRQETLQICQKLNLPIWIDPTNAQLHLARNRIRHQVLPVLDQLHPGSDRRIAELSERVSRIRDTQTQLCQLALQTLRDSSGLKRESLFQLEAATCRVLLMSWIDDCGAPKPNTQSLDRLIHLLRTPGSNGAHELGNNWLVSWNKTLIHISRNF